MCAENAEDIQVLKVIELYLHLETALGHSTPEFSRCIDQYHEV